MNKKRLCTKIKYANYEIIYYMFNNDSSNMFYSILISILLHLQIFSIPFSPIVRFFIIIFYSIYQFGVKIK